MSRVLSESPRWLLSNGQIERAKSEISRAARLNRKTYELPDNLDEVLIQIYNVTHSLSPYIYESISKYAHQIILLFYFRWIIAKYILLEKIHWNFAFKSILTLHSDNWNYFLPQNQVSKSSTKQETFKEKMKSLFSTKKMRIITFNSMTLNLIISIIFTAIPLRANEFL